MTVGEKIKQRRNELGWSQADLAKRMGYSGKSVICKVETTSDENLTTTRIAKFAEALGCSPSYLMGWEEEESKYNESNAELLASLMKDDKLREMVRRIFLLDDAKKESLRQYIDFLLSQSN